MAHDPSPLRLVEDPDTTGPLRMLIDRAKQDLPDDAHLRAFAARLDLTLASSAQSPEMAPDAPNAAPPARPAMVSKLTLGKLSLIGLGFVLGGAVVSVIGFANRGNETRSVASSGATSSVAVTARDDAAPPAPTLAPEPSSAMAAHPAAVPADTAIERSSPRAPTNGAADSRSRSTDPAREPPSEASLLLEARSALAQDAARALRITQEHARLYPSGVLAQEREVIAIEALRRLGRMDVAQKRSAEFDKRYPGSVHRSKIKQALETP
jgi:hypothetical protein